LVTIWWLLPGSARSHQVVGSPRPLRLARVELRRCPKICTRRWASQRLFDVRWLLESAAAHLALESGLPSIGDLEVIDPKRAANLRRAGIRTTDSFLRRAASRKERGDLSHETGIDGTDLLAWALRCDLMRIDGIGPEYSELLAAVGTHSLRDLKRRTSRTLTARMADYNLNKKRLVERLPSENMVEAWIDSAKALDTVVKV